MNIYLKYMLKKYNDNLYVLINNPKFLKCLAKSIWVIDDYIISNMFNTYESIIEFLSFIKSDIDKYKFISNEKILSTIFSYEHINSFIKSRLYFSDKIYYEKLFLLLNKKDKITYLKYMVYNNEFFYLIKKYSKDFSSDEIMNLLIKSTLTDNELEYFFNIVSPSQMGMLLTKIKDYKIKCKYFDKLIFIDKAKYMKYLKDEEKLKYINDKYLKVSVIAHLNNKKLSEKYFLTLSVEDKINVIYECEDIGHILYLISISSFEEKTYLSILKTLLLLYKDQRILYKLSEKDELLNKIYNLKKSDIPNENLFMFPNIKNDITFGVELECFSSYYLLLSKYERFLSSWMVKEEKTVDNGIEFSSPIFKYNKESLNELKFVCDFLRDNDFLYSSSSGGHIHIGFNAFKNAKHLYSFYKIYVICEKELFLLLNRANSKIRDNAIIFAKAISNKLESLYKYDLKFNSMEDEVCYLYNHVNDRSSSLNISNVYFGIKNTLEFRFPNIEMNYEYLHENIVFILKLIEISNIVKTYDIKNLLSYEESQKVDYLLKLLFFDNDYLYNVFSFRYKQNYEVNKENPLIRGIK